MVVYGREIESPYDLSEPGRPLMMCCPERTSEVRVSTNMILIKNRDKKHSTQDPALLRLPSGNVKFTGYGASRLAVGMSFQDSVASCHNRLANRQTRIRRRYPWRHQNPDPTTATRRSITTVPSSTIRCRTENGLRWSRGSTVDAARHASAGPWAAEPGARWLFRLVGEGQVGVRGVSCPRWRTRRLPCFAPCLKLWAMTCSAGCRTAACMVLHVFRSDGWGGGNGRVEDDSLGSPSTDGKPSMVFDVAGFGLG